jgi:asparagine synthase (glutamine-hydrolysing)
METGYFGGILDHEAAERLRGGKEPPFAGDTGWEWSSLAGECFLHARGACCRLFARGPRVLLIRGPIVDTTARRPNDLTLLAERLHRLYLARGVLALDGLEGSFTLALLDGEAGRLLLYRNLAGAGFTYYHESRRGLLFGSNLTGLVDASGASPRPNEDDLPSFFLNRTLPGRNTLFAGFHRLLPGEQLRFGGGQVLLTQRQTLGGLIEGPIGADALECLEETTARICADYATFCPQTANLLSGGVDSSFVQLHWGRGVPEGVARSYCVRVDHPRTRPEADYAVSAADALGSAHTLVPADEPYASYLLESIALTGEVPGHVQLAYFHALARRMVSDGLTAGLHGEGADSLFGLGVGTDLQSAALLRKLVPGRWLRWGGAALAGLCRRPHLSRHFRLANRLHDESWLGHPVNRVVVFADWPAVEACFGAEAVAVVAAERRDLLARHQLPPSHLVRVHAASLLASSANGASLTASLFHQAGAVLLCPFLDSRMLRLVANLEPGQRFHFRRPKMLLKRSLERHGHADLAYRPKLSFGQPIFEWLSPGGQLRPLVDQIDHYDFVRPEVLESVRARPTWFLYNLLCYDLWHKLFIARTLPRSPDALTEHLAATVV